MTAVKLRQIPQPGPARLMAYARFIAVFCALFFPVYFGAAAITTWSGRASGLHFAWETRIPLIPWMILPYISLYSLFLLPLIHMTPAEMARLTRQTIVALLVAFVVFVAMPGRVGFAPEAVSGIWEPLFAQINAVDTPHNEVPSLHVVFAALIVFGCCERVSVALRLAYWGWLAVLCASTIFVHQHHLLDVASGVGLAVIIRRFVPLSAAAG